MAASARIISAEPLPEERTSRVAPAQEPGLRRLDRALEQPGPSLRKAPELPFGTTRPFIKWVGGKHKLLPQLSALFPKDIGARRHVEPFIGGGAMFFARTPKRAHISDLNDDLVNTYRAVRDELPALKRHLRRLAADHDQARYYERRDRYNGKKLSQTERAAMFIYLNRTCFNGLHRVNKKGEFNVPMGRYKNPQILDEARLEAASKALQGATIQHAGFEHLLTSAEKNDFIYLDPPYEPVSESANFTSYAKDGFSRDHQIQLRDVFAELDRRGAKLMLSNSDVPFIREIYAGFRIHTVYCARAINCDASARGKVREVVVTNY